MTQAKAGDVLSLTPRQIRRLCARCEALGPAGLASRQRGRPSNHRLSDELRDRAVAIVRDRYGDFGPTLAHEKLLELHDVRVGRETLRKWLAEAGVWKTRRERLKQPHQPRHRRDCRWRPKAPPAGPTVCRSSAAPSASSTSTSSARTRPRPRPGRADEPDAPGPARQGTPARDIASKEDGNAYLPEFLDDYNQRFARPPRNPHDAHRPLRGDEDLRQIFSWQEERTISLNLTVHFKRVTYLIERSKETIPLAHKRAVIHEWEDGSVEIHCEGRRLPYSVFDNNPVIPQGAVVENKRLGAVLTVIQAAQADRDRQRLAAGSLTNREKRRITATRAEAGVEPKPTSRAKVEPVPSGEGRLDVMLEYLKAFDEQQRSRRKLYNVTAALRRRSRLPVG